MSNFFSHFLPGQWTALHFAARPKWTALGLAARHPGTETRGPTAEEQVLAHRERLLGLTLQLLDDGEAARVVVLRALSQALRSPLLVYMTGLAGQGTTAGASDSPLPAKASPLPSRDEDALSRWLDRLIVGLCLLHLRSVEPPEPGPGRGTSALDKKQNGLPGERGRMQRPSLPTLRDEDRRLDFDREAPQAPRSNDHETQTPPSGAPSLDGRTPLPSIGMGATVTRRRVSVAPPASVGKRTAEGETTGPQHLELAQIRRTAQVLCTLPPMTRVTLVLVIVKGRPLPEVAELLDCGEESLHFWLNHGRKLLRRALQRDLLESDFDPPGTHTLAPPGAIHDLRRGKKATARA